MHKKIKALFRLNLRRLRDELQAVHVLLVREFKLPIFLQRVLQGGVIVFVPIAISVGAGMGASDPTLAVYWFHAAAISAVIATFLWEEILKLGRWRYPVESVAVLLIGLSVWGGDQWVVRKVRESADASIAQTASESKLEGQRRTEIRTRQKNSTNSVSITEDISGRKDETVKATVRRKPRTPHSDQAPPLEPKIDQSFNENLPEIITFSLGGGGVHMGQPLKSLSEGGGVLVNLGGIVPVKFQLENGVVYCDVTIWGGEDGPPITIIHNKFTVKPMNLDRNSSANALEVVDQQGEPIFQFIRKTPAHYVMNGLIPIPQGGFILATDKGTRIGVQPPIPKGALKPIFKYPAWKYPGQYAE